MFSRNSIDTGIVATAWKTANVSAIFKKGTHSDPANYRPVCPLPVPLTSAPYQCPLPVPLPSICKVLEHIIFSHIMKHVNKHILSDCQHGFRHRRSTESQLITTLHDIGQEIDNKHTVDVAVLDFSKVFDKVSHKLLLNKFQYYGIVGSLYQWINNVLRE